MLTFITMHLPGFIITVVLDLSYGNLGGFELKFLILWTICPF